MVYKRDIHKLMQAIGKLGYLIMSLVEPVISFDSKNTWLRSFSHGLIFPHMLSRRESFPLYLP